MARRDDSLAGFAGAFGEGFGAVLPARPRRRGRRPRVPLAQVLSARVFHVMNTAGTLAEHFAPLFEDGLADSSLSERRARLPWEVFTGLMRLGLMRPLWLTLALGGDLLSARQKEQLTDRFLERAGRYVTRRRKRPRSCPRAVRQPVSGWPRRRRNQSWEGPVQFRFLRGDCKTPDKLRQTNGGRRIFTKNQFACRHSSACIQEFCRRLLRP